MLNRPTFGGHIRRVSLFLLIASGLLHVGGLHEGGVQEVVGALDETLADVFVAVALDFHDEVLETGEFGVLEDGVEAHHAALAHFPFVLDVEHLETAGIALEVVHRGGLADDGPVHIHLEEYQVRIRVLEHVVVHHLVFHLLELVGVVVVAVLDAGGLAAAAHFVQVVTVDLEILEGGLEAYPGSDDVLHAGLLVHLDALVPPGEGGREVTAVQFFAGQAAGDMGGKDLHAGGFHLLLEDLGGVPVDETVVAVIAGGLDGGVTHRSDLLQDVGVVVMIEDAAGGVHLHAHILLHGSGFLGSARRNCDHGEEGQGKDAAFHGTSPSA